MKHLSILAGALLLGFLATGLPSIAAPAQINAPEKAATKQMVREVLKENPEILMEALDNLRKQMESGQTRESRNALSGLRKELERDPDTFIAGNPAGDITIVEFFDYRCGYCKQAQPVIEQLVKQDGRIRLALKEFPILGPDSVVASRAAIAAMRQKKYAPFHAALMATQGALSETRVLRIATGAGLDATRLRTDMDDPKIEKIIGRNHEIAESLGISGTPSFIIGDTLVPGAAELDKLQRLVAAARSECLTC
ncbi:MAG: DsbA family protein [Alphaproteobacteria bacterium]|nr:DsbA family protein [Alphaproteobacteria bacterium]